MHIFISYARENQEFALSLREKLIQWGYETWIDSENIPKGAYWADEINNGLKKSDLVIGIMSQDALDSINVKNEWDWAIVNQKRLILLRHQKCEIHVNYIRINYIDFVSSIELGFESLKIALQNPQTTIASDSYTTYLQWLYNFINDYLAAKLIPSLRNEENIPEPLQLRTESTPSAVNVLFEKQEWIHPLFKIGGITPTRIPDPKNFQEAFDYFEGRLLLLGDAGMGKTITLLHFARDAVVRRLQDTSQPIPFWGTIASWTAESHMPLVEWLYKDIEPFHSKHQLTKVALERTIQDGKAILVLDGLDELGREREEQDTKERYDPRQRFLKIIPPNNQLLISCRIQDYEEIGEKLKLNGAITLQPLDDSQMQTYLRDLPALWMALEKDADLREVARTPLLLSLFTIAFQDAEVNPDIFADLSGGDLRDKIFETYVNQRYAHEARKPNANIPFSLQTLKNLLGELAIQNIAGRKGKRENLLTQEDFQESIKGVEIDSFLKFCIHLHILVEDTYYDYVSTRPIHRFIHLLMRDYFGYQYAIENLRNTSFYIRNSPYDKANPAEVLLELADWRSVEALIDAAMEGEHEDTRGWSIAALEKIQDIRVVEQLKQIIRKEKNKKVRSAAAHAIGILDSTNSFELLLDILAHDKNQEVRFRVADAFGEIREKHAVKYLCDSLAQDRSKLVRRSVALALDRIGEKEAIPYLSDALIIDTDTEVRFLAASALGRLGSDMEVGVLEIALDDHERFREYFVVSHAAELALQHIGTPKSIAALEKYFIASLEMELEYNQQKFFINKLTELDTKIALEVVQAWWIKELAIQEAPYRYSKSRRCDIAVEKLEEIGTPEALEAVRKWRESQPNNS